MSYVERAQYELVQLDFWFKKNQRLAGTEEWIKNIERGIELSETVNNL
jgi:hypothetical protein